MTVPGFATVPPWDRTEARFQLAVTIATKEDRENLTCMICWGPRCEWTTTFHTGARRVWVGLHEHCIQRLETPVKP